MYNLYVYKAASDCSSKLSSSNMQTIDARLFSPHNLRRAAAADVIDIFVTFYG
jgi:hypothetical protein